MLELIKAIYKNKLIGTYDDDSAAKVLAEELERIQEIKNSLRNLQKELEKNAKEYLEKNKAVTQKINDVRSICKHEVTHYHSDPAGGRDSYYECTICGATV